MSVKVTVRFHKDALVSVMRNAAAKGLNAGAISMQGTMKATVNNPPWSKAGGPPGRLFGKLYQRINVQEAVPTSLVSRAGTDAREGRFMQWGVRKSGKWLTVPLNKEAARLLAGAGSVRNIHNLKWHPGRSRANGGLLGFETRGRDRGFRPMFVLKSRVAARPWASIALRTGSQAARASIADTFQSTYRREIRALVRGSVAR